VKSKSRDLYAVGRIRALEKELFDQGRFSRLAENASAEKFATDLSDTKYAPFIKESGLHRGMEEYLHRAYLFIRENSSNPEAADIFHFRRDIMNYINRLRGIEEDDAFSPGPLGDLWWKKEKLPPVFRRIEDSIRKKYNSVSEAPDSYIEKASMDEALNTFPLENSGRAVRKYYADYVDIRNLMMNLFNEKAFYWEGGSVKPAEWDDISIAKEIPHKLAARGYVRAVSGHKDLFTWEVILASWLSSGIRDMRMITFGPEPAVAYYLSLREEINNLRTVLTGILSFADPDEIKGRLNLEYL